MTRYFRSVATIVALLIGIAGVTLTLYAWRLPPFSSTVETTNNAYVCGRVTILAPQLSGYVATVEVQDFERVAEGQVLVRLDDRIYRQKVVQAQATLAGQKVALANWEQTRLSKTAAVNSAKAQLASAEAAFRTAEANHERNTRLLSREVAKRGSPPSRG